MSRDRRGQMLLVAGLALAVAFVALALVLNTVVFTENLATRNHDQTDDALGFEAAAEEGVGGLIAEANRHDDSDYGTLESALQGSVQTWDANATVLAVADGSVTETSLVGVQDGTRIRQGTAGPLDDGSGNGDPTLAAGATDVRRFVLEVDPDDGETVTLNVSTTSGAASWAVEIADGAGGDTTVTVYRNGTQVGSTTDGDSTVTVDVTEGTVDGDVVDNWTFAAGVPAPYDVQVANGDDATGRYQLVVPGQSVASEGPTTRPAIYSADVNLTVRRSKLTYQTTLTVAPESGPWNETLAT